MLEDGLPSAALTRDSAGTQIWDCSCNFHSTTAERVGAQRAPTPGTTFAAFV